MSRVETHISQDIKRLDAEIRAGRLPEIAKSPAKPADKSAKSSFEAGRPRTPAPMGSGFVGRARFAASAKEAMAAKSLAERAADLIESLPREKRGEYLAYVINRVYEKHADELGFSQKDA